MRVRIRIRFGVCRTLTPNLLVAPSHSPWLPTTDHLTQTPTSHKAVIPYNPTKRSSCQAQAKIPAKHVMFYDIKRMPQML